MKFSEQWLRTWVDPNIDSSALADRLSMAGLEVEGRYPAAPPFTDVVIAEILQVDPHPNADKLRVCQVGDGAEQVQVVCGAPNARVGIKVPFAKVGAHLPNDLKIKAAALRGVESKGMLCGADELGLEAQGDGLLELPTDAPIGINLREYMNLDDVIIEVNLTPNRGDCLSLLGMARETSALTGSPLTSPIPLDDFYKAVEQAPLKTNPTLTVEKSATKVEVVLLSKDACPKYAGRVIENINAQAKTPLWMAQRLERSGIRSINPVVDVTNYVMIELGQPMHAFDLDCLSGGVQVRMAKSGELLKLLNDQEIELNDAHLIIADQRQPLALAGIMGGLASAVTENTQNIFLESAHFLPLAMAGKARALGLHSESSHRFERGVDPALITMALERATELLLKITGGNPGPITLVELREGLPQISDVVLRQNRIVSLLGISLPKSDIEKHLKALGFGLIAQNASEIECEWLVQVPSHRFDVTIEVDLIEELARMHGYDQIPVCEPDMPGGFVAKSESQMESMRFKRTLNALGYQEVITYSFISPELSSFFANSVDHITTPITPITLLNPISADMSVMRQSLLPGLVLTAKHNLNRQWDRVRVYEMGMCFNGTLDETKQDIKLAGLITGHQEATHWQTSEKDVSFYDIKGDVEALLALSGIQESFNFKPFEHPALHPGQSAVILKDGKTLGYLGALHPSLCSKLGLTTAYVFELDWGFLQHSQAPKFKELSRFPIVRRDLAWILPQEVTSAQVQHVIESEAGEHLHEVKLFDVYMGQGIENGFKSLAYAIHWQHPERTLTDDEINATVERIVLAISQQLHGNIRA